MTPADNLHSDLMSGQPMGGQNTLYPMERRLEMLAGQVAQPKASAVDHFSVQHSLPDEYSSTVRTFIDRRNTKVLWIVAAVIYGDASANAADRRDKKTAGFTRR
jgi:hypothetical protein